MGRPVHRRLDDAGVSRVHAEWASRTTSPDAERGAAAERGLSIRSVFGHTVPDSRGAGGRVVRHPGRRRSAAAHAQSRDEIAFLDSVVIALDAVMDYAKRLAQRCDAAADRQADPTRSGELRQMAANLRQAPAGPAQTYWQALQAVWLLHMVFHATVDGNTVGRLDQSGWLPPGGRSGSQTPRYGICRRTDRLLLPEVQRTRENHR